MFTAIFGSIESGIIFGIMALGVYLSFRVLDFPDLTVDGSFVTGAAIAAMMIVHGYNPFLATFIAFFGGMIAGFITGFLHTKGKINPLLSGILVMIALYSINLRIMGKPNIPLINDKTVFTYLENFWSSFGFDQILQLGFAKIGLQHYAPKTWSLLLCMLIFTITIKLILDRFLKSQLGLALRATGSNKYMIRSFSANTDNLTMLGLGVANGLVALSGALIAQYSSFADVQMGFGMIIIGLASVIIGEAIFGVVSIPRITLAVIGGSILYRLVVALSLRIRFLDTGDMKLITASLVILALIIPKLMESHKERKKKHKNRLKNLTLSDERT